MQFFGISTKIAHDGQPIELAYPYANNSAKVRKRDAKEFYTTGPSSEPELFGRDKFNAGGASITIVEGELDAASCYQITRSPVVSVRSSSTAKADCKKWYDYLNSFKKIILCLDNDHQGRTAARTIAGLFDFNKVYSVRLTRFKDANEFLESGAAAEFAAAWSNASRYLPENVISSFREYREVIEAPPPVARGTWPFSRIQHATHGLFPGQAILVTAESGAGKTEFIRATEHHLLKTTDDNLAPIHIEESKARQVRGLVGYELQRPCHLPNSKISNEELFSVFKGIVRRDDRLHMYTHFGSQDPDVILGTIRFLAGACDCKYVFLDHISMVVSGLALEDERKMLDKISTSLRMMTEELGFTLVFISHINQHEGPRGSQAIQQVADTWIHLKRDKENEDPNIRNKMQVSIRKNRLGAVTGPCGELEFNEDTWMLKDVVVPQNPPVN